MKRDNIFRAYIRICMALLLLCSFVDSTYSKSFKTTKESNRVSNQLVSDSVRVEQQSESISVFAAGSCVNTFENQTVSSKLSIQGCNTLTVQNVTVTSNGDLTLSAPGAIVINGPFETQLGGVLNITKKESLIIEFNYDEAGNRISRMVVQVE